MRAAVIYLHTDGVGAKRPWLPETAQNACLLHRSSGHDLGRKVLQEQVDDDAGPSEAYTEAMRDKELYARIVGIEAPWRVEDVKLNQQGEVVVRVAHDGGPVCSRPANRYDTRQRRWRHLDTFQYRAILERDRVRHVSYRRAPRGCR